VAAHSSVRITSYLRPPYTHYSSQISINQVCNLSIMWADISHVSHPHSNTDLTLLLNIMLLVFSNTALFSHNGYRVTTPFAVLVRDFNIFECLSAQRPRFYQKEMNPYGDLSCAFMIGIINGVTRNIKHEQNRLM
jgi:hypothetical protein